MDARAVSIGEEEDDSTPSADCHYFPGSCVVCKAIGGDSIVEQSRLDRDRDAPVERSRLSRCSSCQAVSYCSRWHQRLDWPRHRAACRWLRRNMDAFMPPATGTVADPETETSWNLSRATLAVDMCRALGRALSVFERELIQFAPVCEVCRRYCRRRRADDSSLGQLQCLECHSAFYCSRECLKRDEKRHRRWCSPLLMALRCDQREARQGLVEPVLSSEVQTEYNPLSGGVDAFISPDRDQTDSDSIGVSQHATLDSVFQSERLTFPLSVLFALQRLAGTNHASRVDLATRRTLTIHVIGAKVLVECVGVIKWELLLHRLPALQRLHLVFVGPELFEGCGQELEEDGGEVTASPLEGVDDSGATRCDDCAAKNRLVIHELRAITYHEYCTTTQSTETDQPSHDGGSNPRGSQPDLLVCFNAGLHEHEREGEAEDCWLPSLPFLNGEAGLGQPPPPPLLLTAYTRDELDRDVARLPDMCVAVGPLQNPYAGLRPYRDPERRSSGADCFYLNQFIAVLTR